MLVETGYNEHLATKSVFDNMDLSITVKKILIKIKNDETYLHAVHVELIVNHTAAGVGGHGQGGDGGGDVVVAGSADQRRGQDRARP